MPTNVLLIGASGFLGWNFATKLQHKYQINGTYFRNNPSDLSIHLHKVNLLESKSLQQFVQQIQPDIIVHLAAISKPAYCEQHPALSYHVNVYATLELAKIAAQMSIPLLFSSTDLVFNGTSGGYKETDFCYPLSQYGLQKQTAEESLLTDFEHTYVARLPLMFGWGPSYHHNFLTNAFQSFEQTETIQAFTDEFRTMISADVACQWLSLLIDYILSDKTDKERLFHTAGSERYSRFEFMQAVAKVFDKDISLIQPTLQKALNLVPKRPADVSLDSSMAQHLLKYKAPSIIHQLEQLKLNFSK